MVRTRTVMTGVFASVGALLIGWQFGAAAHTAVLTPPSHVNGAAGGTANGEVAPVTPTVPGTSPAPTTTAKDDTFTGSSVDTPFGSVQVAVTISAGSISDVAALHLTDNGGRSVQISNYAAPILRGEVIQSQSAKVDSVSGATYTSEAYLSSLQSALDQAGH